MPGERGTYLSTIGFGGTDIGDAYSAAAWAALVSPFFVGLIADRFFAAQRVLGLLHLVASACLFWVSTLTDPTAFFFGLLLMMLCYMPTVALTNAVCFHQMSDAGSEFPTVRVFGTIGWIAAGWLVGEEGRGINVIMHMVNGTRIDVTNWSAALMRQAVSQAAWYVSEREAFGGPLIDKPLMQNVLADLELETEVATMMVLRLAGAHERAAIDDHEAG
ncbi:MAG: acyl-CoA dehydrogenase family protein, partial [Candidatus Latescibacterota bacterium]